MSELEFLESRILHHQKRLRTAEANYQHAVTHGTKQDKADALSACQAVRATLILFLHRRDRLTGGEHSGKAD